MTKILQEYLLPIVREDGMKTVQSIVGKLTAMIRKSWGLNLYKNKDNDEDYRAFHNHHAIDAIIASVINRGNIGKTA
jgi:CRISPR/Cas system Type II protein with McrA/HNH and RuvC-like nuclease domain